MKLIGLSGLIGSGKRTVADILEKNHNFTKVSFADSVKDSVAVVFGWPRNLLDGNTPESRDWREVVDHWWANRLNIPHLTPRWVIQFWGTELCRHNFHEDIWIASLERKLLRLNETNPNTKLVISDIRFPNEMKVIKNLGGKTWCIKRGIDPVWFTTYANGGETPKNIHPSEWEWARESFNCTIRNNGTKDELVSLISSLLGY